MWLASKGNKCPQKLDLSNAERPSGNLKAPTFYFVFRKNKK
jgi:hypothetical protein